jgi:enamine deaminase RidA (YjgF/YER057c/UK114 family)
LQQVTCIFLLLFSISCSTSKNPQHKSVALQTDQAFIKNVSDTSIRLPRGASQAVWAGNTVYVSGSLDPDMKLHTTTEQQTVGLLSYLKKFLESQGLTFGNVVMVRVYLGADPNKGGKMDFAGMQAGYKQFFGTVEQPNKPARTTVQVVLPAADAGALIEIDLVAVKSN